MSENLESLIKHLRKNENISLKELSRGICSLTSLSRIELGERQPSKILFDALLSKLWKNSEKLELILRKNDKKLIYHRNYIDFLIKYEKWEQIDFYLEEYKKLIEIDEELNEQYISTIKTIIYKENKEYNKAFKECIYALKLTKLNINLDNLKIAMILCKSELKLLCLLGESLLEGNLKSILEVYYYWKEIFNYIELCRDRIKPIQYYLNCWEVLKLTKLQHKVEINLSVNVTKVEKIS